MGIPCGDVLEIDVYISAADHAQVFHLVFAELKVFHAGAFLGENGPGQLFASVLHGAAADGAGNAAVFGDEHPGSCTPWGGAGTGDYGDQDSVLSLG